MRVDKQLASVQSDFQRIDVFDSVEFGQHYDAGRSADADRER